MFSTGRAVWIRGFAGDSDDAEQLLALLSGGIPPECTLVLSGASIDQRSRLYKWFVANGAVEDLTIGLDKRGRLRDEDLEAFIRKRVEALGAGPAAPDVVTSIRDRAGTDVGDLAQEIEKLCLACAGRSITVRDVRAHVRDQAEAWVFDLTNALSDRRLDRATLLVSSLLGQGEPPLRMVAVLANHVAELIEAARVGSAVPAVALRHPGAFARDYFPKLPVEVRTHFKSGFRAYYIFRGAAAFRLDELRKLHTALVGADLALKSSQVSPQHLLVQIVEQACTHRARDAYVP
jgi:DNA polymerase-3 subunit delta